MRTLKSQYIGMVVATMVLPLLLALTLSASGNDVTARSVKSASESTVETRAEVVFGSACRVEILPGDNFLLHIPLSDTGEMQGAKAYTTGKVHFHVPRKDCGRIQVTKVPESNVTK